MSTTPRVAIDRYCLRCSYALRDSSVSRCPECGLAFDHDDPTTYFANAHPGHVARLLLRPIGWPTYFLLACVALVNLIVTSSPGKLDWRLVSYFPWVVLGAYWIFRWMAFDSLRKGFHPGAVLTKGATLKWITVPAVFVLTMVIIWVDGSIRVRFMLSQAEMVEVAKPLLSANGTPPNIPPGGVRLGLYTIKQIEVCGNSVKLAIGLDAWGEGYGFAYCPCGEPEDYPVVYKHLTESWYLWWAYH